MTKAVIDRIEGEKAVLLVGREQDRLIVKMSFLPNGAKVGDWLKVNVEDDRVLSATLDKKETELVKKRTSDKLDVLRRGDHRKK